MSEFILIDGFNNPSHPIVPDDVSAAFAGDDDVFPAVAVEVVDADLQADSIYLSSPVKFASWDQIAWFVDWKFLPTEFPLPDRTKPEAVLFWVVLYLVNDATSLSSNKNCLIRSTRRPRSVSKRVKDPSVADRRK